MSRPRPRTEGGRSVEKGEWGSRRQRTRMPGKFLGERGGALSRPVVGAGFSQPATGGAADSFEFGGPFRQEKSSTADSST